MDMASIGRLARRWEKRYGGAMTQHSVDARGLKCPLPVLLARKALRAAAAGDVVELIATDRGVDADVLDLCEATGAALLEATREGDAHRFLLRRP
jgi:tRNA 2-thiouridine synthesizing protein A